MPVERSAQKVVGGNGFSEVGPSQEDLLAEISRLQLENQQLRQLLTQREPPPALLRVPSDLLIQFRPHFLRRYGGPGLAELQKIWAGAFPEDDRPETAAAAFRALCQNESLRRRWFNYLQHRLRLEGRKFQNAEDVLLFAFCSG